MNILTDYFDNMLYLSILIIGLLTGTFCRKISLFKKLDTSISATIWTMLFVFGVSIGSNKELVSKEDMDHNTQSMANSESSFITRNYSMANDFSGQSGPQGQGQEAPWGNGPPPSGDPTNPYGYDKDPSDPNNPQEGERDQKGLRRSRGGGGGRG